MGLFFELVVVGAVTWWFAESAVRSWWQRRAARAAMGAHDHGVWVNDDKWEQIVAELESRDRGHEPGHGD
ncbi:MAG TPA: hypothetical protein VH912_14755 [Streptosporangiaceae bacterium]|jgi:hypothetical protein